MTWRLKLQQIKPFYEKELDLDLDFDSENKDEDDDNGNDHDDDDSTGSGGSGAFSSTSSEASDDATNRRQNGGNFHRNKFTNCSTNYAREKLVRILNGDVVVPKQRWGIDRILATLTYHRKDQRLRSSYRQFKQFAYQTLFEESDASSGQFPHALTKKDWNLIIKLKGKSEMEKRYRREIQILCKTPCFGAVDSEPGIINKHPLEGIVEIATEKAPLISSMVFGVGPTSLLQYPSKLHLISMKLVAVLVILCRSAHRNNSNYLPLMVALCLYSAGAKVDAITLLNHLGLSVSYNVLQSKLRDITLSSKQWIRQQAQNRQLVGTWDNFEFRENVQGERVGDVVKFRSITMALWIERG